MPPQAEASEEARNVAILKEAYRRWSESRGGSADYWVSICDENLNFGSIAEPLAGVDYMTSYRRRDDVGQYFEGLARDWEMIEYRVDHFVAQGDRVVALGYCSWRAKKSGAVWRPRRRTPGSSRTARRLPITSFSTPPRWRKPSPPEAGARTYLNGLLTKREPLRP